MGIKFYCPNGHKLNVKSFLAGKKGVCPECGVSLVIPLESQRKGKTKTPAASAAGPPAGTVVSAAVSPAATTPSVAPIIPTAPLVPQPVAPYPQPHVAALPQQPFPQPAIPQGIPAQPTGAAPVAAVSPALPIAPTVPTAVPVGAAVGAPVVARAAVPPAPAAAAPLVDPIVEAPQAVWYVRPPAGGQYGPARGDIMRKWIAEGRVTADSLVWRDGWADWKKGGLVFPSLPGASVSAAAVAPTPSVLGPAMGTSAAPAASDFPISVPSSPISRTPRRGKRGPSKSMAITVVIVLGMLAIGLLVALVLVIQNNTTGH